MNSNANDSSNNDKKSKRQIYCYDKTKGISAMTDDESDMTDLELDGTEERSMCFEQNKHKQQGVITEPNSLGWADWIRFKTESIGLTAVDMCDIAGNYLASFFGITTPKYQFEIDYYNTLKEMEKEGSDMELGNSVSDEK